MSDYTVEERLEGCWRGLRWNSIFLDAGIILIPLLLLMKLDFLWAALIGGTVWGFPVLKAFFFGGFGTALTGPLKADYEVVTYQDGVRVSSDGGAQSMQTNILNKLLLLGAVWAFALFAVPIHVVFLSVKGIILHLKAKIKPPFLKSVFFIMILNVAAFLSPTFFVQVAKNADDAARGVAKNKDYSYVLTTAKDGVIIEKYRGKEKDVVVPAEINGLPVVMIDKAFSMSNVTSVVIPEGVTDIGSNAFYGCGDLVSVTLPGSIIRIGGSVFPSNSLTDVKIPSGTKIMYVSYYTGNTGIRNAVPLGFTTLYFVENEKPSQFSGKSKLSEASKQAIRDSGYTGDF